MKQYIDSVKNQLIFADRLKVTDTLTTNVTLGKTSSGIGMTRWGAKQLVNTVVQPRKGCADDCKTIDFVRKYDLSVSGNLPTTPEEFVILKNELKQFFQDIDTLVAAGAMEGVKPSIATTFENVVVP